MLRAVLLAHPAGHSLSPVMQDAAFEAAGIDARYEAWDVAPEALADAVERFRDGGMLGANVSVPHKRAVMALLDDVSEEAARIGAVNTIRRDGSRLVGENTDAEGFLRSVREAGLEPEGRVIVLLGAGGAARAVAWALVGAGARELRIVNRTAASGEALAADVRGGCRAAVRAFLVGDPAAHVGADVWVNATSVGMARAGVHPDASPVAPEALAVGATGGGGAPGVAVDLVYRPRRTRFLRDAATVGLTTIDGLGMLVHQGAASFRAWTGREAPTERMRRAVERALAAEVGT